MPDRVDAGFPVDDVTLAAVEHALNASLVDGDDGPVVVGAEFGLSRLLEFLSGYDADATVPTETPAVDEYTGGIIWHEHDIIRAYAAEIRRLRATQGATA